MNISRYPARQLPSDLFEAWTELQQNEPALNHPLFHPVWVELAAAVCDQVEVGVLHQAGEAVGFLPFERSGRRQGRPVAAWMSDLHGLIARPGTECDLAQLVRGCQLSVWRFDHVPVEQDWFAPYHAGVEDAPVIDLDEGFDLYWERRREASSSWTGQIQRKSRKLAREVGPLRFVWHATDDRVLAALAQWKQQQLQASNLFNVFALAWLRPLLRSVCGKQEQAFAGVLSGLYAGDRLVAVHLGVRNQHLLASWIPAFDPQYAHYSPGALLHVELARAAADCGIQRIELGRGLNPLKQALASSARRLAIGAVDLRPAGRWRRAGWRRLRDLVHSTPLGGLPLQAFRRVRNWAASHS